jgi:catechol 2,3-dioxygenase-like lactoylglutathione lyase family enzyme
MLGMAVAKGYTMISLTSPTADADPETADDLTGAVASNPSCYSVTIFTQRWKEVRDFYVDILNARVLSERTDRYCEIDLGGIPLTIRLCEHGEMVSYFHLYVSMKTRDSVLGELRRRGIIVTSVGPYTNFRDPEGRVIKLSEEKMIVS